MSDSNLQTANTSVSRPVLAVLLSVVFLDNLGFAIILPYVYFYVQSFGAPIFVYGLLLASYSLMSFIFTPVVSRLSDRYGRRNVLLVALAVSSFSYFIFGIGETLWVLFLGRMLAGTTAATVPVAQAYVADITTEKDRLRYLGYLAAAAGIAFIIGPAVGGTLSALFGFGVPAFLASALAFTNLISTYFCLPEPPRTKESTTGKAFTSSGLRSVFRKRTIQLLFMGYFLFFLAFMFLQSILTPWLEEVFGFGSFNTGLVFFYFGAIIALTQLILLPRLSKRFSNTTLASYGLVVLFVGFLILGVLASFPLFLVVTAVVSFGSALLLVTFTTLISISAPREAQGGTLGIAQSLVGLAQTIAPTLATAVFAFGTSIGITGLAFIVSAAITISITPLILTLKKQLKPDADT